MNGRGSHERSLSPRQLSVMVLSLLLLLLLLLVGCAGGSRRPRAIDRSDLTVVDADHWLAEICEATAPVHAALRTGLALVAVPGPGGSYTPRNLDEAAFQELDEWLDETASLTEDVADELIDAGAPDTERGVDLAYAQVRAYQSLAASLRDGADRLDPTNPLSADGASASITGAANRYGDFGRVWQDVEPFNRRCPRQASEE